MDIKNWYKMLGKEDAYRRSLFYNLNERDEQPIKLKSLISEKKKAQIVWVGRNKANLVDMNDRKKILATNFKSESEARKYGNKKGWFVSQVSVNDIQDVLRGGKEWLRLKGKIKEDFLTEEELHIGNVRDEIVKWKYHTIVYNSKQVEIWTSGNLEVDSDNRYIEFLGNGRRIALIDVNSIKKIESEKTGRGIKITLKDGYLTIQR